MGFYSRRIFPHVCDLVLDRPCVAQRRRELIQDARGEVLEIGFGTGLNLPHYPECIRRITTIDPNFGMQRKGQRRIEKSGIRVDQLLLSSEALPFDGGAFDCVISTFTLCSIEDVNLALGEVRRVLKPGGRFLFLEHGLSLEPWVQRWQRRLNWLQRRVGDNCRLDRNVRELVECQAFTAVNVREFYLERLPRTHGYLYQGTAIR